MADRRFEHLWRTVREDGQWNPLQHFQSHYRIEKCRWEEIGLHKTLKLYGAGFDIKLPRS